jgi:hypothetical protein
MSWFGPKLEPGERIVVALPGREDHGFWVGMGGFLVVVEGALVMAMDAFLGIDRLTTVIVFGGSFALLAFALSRWQFIVTDRRLLRRRGLRSRVEEIALGEVEDIRTEMGSFAERIVIRANGREMTIAMIGVDPAPIVRALRTAKGAA